MRRLPSLSRIAAAAAAAVVLTGAVAAQAGPAQSGKLANLGALGLGLDPGAPSGATLAIGADTAPTAQIWLVSGSGEAGEGGEGPAFDPARAKTDAVEFQTALEMAAAHYHAGRAAYAAGQHSVGAEMFAHGISEVYVDLEPALKQAGVTDFKPQMEKAVELAAAEKPQAEIDAAVDTVLAALVAAREHAPTSSMTPAALRRQVFTEVMNRAAHNYMIAARGTSRDAYLDGFGYRIAAERRAADVIADLKATAPESVAKVEAALVALKAGFASIEKPATGTVPPGDLLVAVSKALLAVSSS